MLHAGRMLRAAVGASRVAASWAGRDWVATRLGDRMYGDAATASVAYFACGTWPRIRIGRFAVLLWLPRAFLWIGEWCAGGKGSQGYQWRFQIFANVRDSSGLVAASRRAIPYTAASLSAGSARLCCHEANFHGKDVKPIKVFRVEA